MLELCGPFSALVLLIFLFPIAAKFLIKLHQIVRRHDLNISTEVHGCAHKQEGEVKKCRCWAKGLPFHLESQLFIWALLIRFIYTFDWTWNNFGSGLTCSDGHESAEPRLIPLKHGITYGINGSCCYVSIYLPGLRVTRAGAIISSVRVLYFFLCQLRALSISQASLGEMRFSPLLKRLWSFCCRVIFFFFMRVWWY